MEKQIVNKIKDSGLIQLDLEQLITNYKIDSIDISEILYEGLLLREKDFRVWIQTHDWQKYTGKGVYLFCSTDAIIPTWAYMLITSQLVNIAKKVVVGNEKLLHLLILSDMVLNLDETIYIDAKVIVKGCANIIEPALAMSLVIQKLQPVASSIMFGEPCSTVPIYKRKKV